MPASNLVYVTGSTTSFDLPWRDNLQAFNGAGDAFVARFDPTSPGGASLIYVTPLGGTSPAGAVASAAGNAIAADQNGHVYVAGMTTSEDFPTAVTTETALNGFQPACSSCQSAPPVSDAFVAEIAESAQQLPSAYFNVGSVPFPASTVGVPSSPQPVAVLNGGEAGLTITSVEISGANSGDFSLIGGTTCVGQTISPGPAAQCSFEVVFTPSTTALEIAVVAVTDNAPGSPQILELIAAGQGPYASISPASVNFGSQPQNSSSLPQVVSVTNSGNQNLDFANVVVAGADAAEFAPAQGGNCGVGISLQPGGSCEFVVQFEPNAVRTFNAEIDFTDNSGGVANAEQVVRLTGVGTATAPVANLTPSSLSFVASQTVGTASASRTVTLTNQGSSALDIVSVTVAGANASDFVIASSGSTCPIAGGTVAIQASCAVAVQLDPKTAGQKSASLNFSDNAAGSPQQVALSGSASSAPSLVVSPQSLAFPAQSEGIASPPQNVSILNNGAAANDVTGITVTGPNAADFSSASACIPNPVPPGASCQIAVTFNPAPTTPGTRSAILNVPQGTPPTVSLSGTATQSSVSVPTGVNFGSQLAGGAGGAAQPIMVTNTSSGPFAGALTVSSVAKSGANPGDFVLSSDSCTGATTSPGSTCTFQVAFKPLQLATCVVAGTTRSGTLMLSDNAPGSPQSIPVSGTATDFCIDVPSGQPIIQPITAGQSATYVLEIDPSGGVSGSAALSCSVPAALLGTCTVTTTLASNPPVVQFSSGSPGQFQVVVTTTPQPVVTVVPSYGHRENRSLSGAILIQSVALVCLAIITAAIPRARQRTLRKLAQAGALLLISAIVMAACGGGGTAAPSDPPPGTPAGSYMITLTASATVAGQPTITRTLPLSLTVQ